MIQLICLCLAMTSWETVTVMPTQPAITSSRLTTEALEQGVKYVQSQQ